MVWNVRFTIKAAKQTGLLNKRARLMLHALIDNLKTNGPAPGKHWHNYGKLYGPRFEDKRHCHLTKGKPTYVCCWKVDKVEKLIEVYYVGTHEKTPY